MTDDPRRHIPAVDQWLESARGKALCREYSRDEVLAVVRESLNAVRRNVARGASALPDFEGEEFELELRSALVARRTDSLRPAINATGIVIHTNLGRAPLADEAVDAMVAVARGYSTLEYDVEHGKRGSRYTHVEPLLTELTGAEAALVVNNCAAAVTLALRTFCKDSEVLISRGELIEIGGSFRMPDVIAESGAIMTEVGTTNRTSLDDYARAMTDSTKAVLTSHMSNYRIVGFTSKPGLSELVALAHEHDCLCIQDLGSGMLVSLDSVGLGKDEPTVRESLAEGADLVAFSGDKILGGPQAGILVGRRELIDTLRRAPLLRAMRIDKLSLAALAATLRLYLPPNDPFKKVPVLRMLTEPKDNVARRLRRLVERLESTADLEATIVDGVSFAGGGTLPIDEIPTKLVRIEHKHFGADELARRLRDGDPPVIGRIHDGALQLDLRTVRPHETARLVEALLGLDSAETRDN